MKYYSVFSYRGQPSVAGSTNRKYSSWFTIHNPYVNSEVFVYNAVLKMEDSVSGTFTFKVPITHPNINAFDCGLIVEIREFDGEPASDSDANLGGTPIWIGRLINLSSDMYGNLNCTCEGPLGFLKDAFICATNAPTMPAETSILDYIKNCIAILLNGYQGEYILSGINPSYAHDRAPGIEISEVTTSLGGLTTYLGAYIRTLKDFEVTEDETQAWYNGSEPKNLFDFIKEYFETGLSSISGIQYANEYVWMGAEVIPSRSYSDQGIPKTSGIRLILGHDDITDIKEKSKQRVVFGENLINAELEYDFNNIATSLMVLGAEYDDENGRKVRYNLNGQMDNGKLAPIAGWYIDADNGAIEKYGVIPKTVVNDNLDLGNTVLWANMNRNALANPVVGFKVTAVDLSIIDPTVEPFKLGEYAEVRFPGLDARETLYYYRCTGVSKNLSDPSKDEFKFSYTKETNLTSNSIFKNVSTTAGSESALGEKYELPTASNDILGGIRVGNNLNMSDTGILDYILPAATHSDGSYDEPVKPRIVAMNIPSAGNEKHPLGGIIVGDTLTVDKDGVLNVAGSSSDLPIATHETLGGVIVGDNLSVDENGLLKMLYVDAGRVPKTSAGDRSTAEGYNNTASGDYTHVEGFGNDESGESNHVEGVGNSVSGTENHVEGYHNNVSGNRMHVGGSLNTVLSSSGHVFGERNNLNSSHPSYIFGSNNSLISSAGVYVLGSYNSDESNVDGHTTPNNTYIFGSHNSIKNIEISKISKLGSGLKGSHNTFFGGYNSMHRNSMYSMIGGYGSHVSRDVSFVYGYGLDDKGTSMLPITIFGQFNAYNYDEDINYDHFNNTLFIIGNGKPSNSLDLSYSTRSNAFRVTNTEVFGGAYNSSGADYAELYEWIDGNIHSEDRVGRFVTLNGEYITLANSNTRLDNILGIISGNPSVAGDVYDDQWSGMYLTDVYGRPIYEEVRHDAELDDEGNIIREAYYSMERKVNPDYDPEKPYTPRSQRPEWDYVGIIGKLVMLDDGTAEVNGYVKPSDNGIATKSEDRTRYRVMRRLDENHIKITILL